MTTPDLGSLIANEDRTRVALTDALDAFEQVFNKGRRQQEERSWSRPSRPTDRDEVLRDVVSAAVASFVGELFEGPRSRILTAVHSEPGAVRRHRLVGVSVADEYRRFGDDVKRKTESLQGLPHRDVFEAASKVRRAVFGTFITTFVHKQLGTVDCGLVVGRLIGDLDQVCRTNASFWDEQSYPHVSFTQLSALGRAWYADAELLHTAVDMVLADGVSSTSHDWSRRLAQGERLGGPVRGLV